MLLDDKRHEIALNYYNAHYNNDTYTAVNKLLCAWFSKADPSSEPVSTIMNLLTDASIEASASALLFINPADAHQKGSKQKLAQAISVCHTDVIQAAAAHLENFSFLYASSFRLTAIILKHAAPLIEELTALKQESSEGVTWQLRTAHFLLSAAREFVHLASLLAAHEEDAYYLAQKASSGFFDLRMALDYVLSRGDSQTRKRFATLDHHIHPSRGEY